MVKFRVIGIPAPKGSVTVMRNGSMRQGKTPGQRERYETWAGQVATAAAAAWNGRPALDVPVFLSVEFRMPRPKSRPHDVWHTTTPDLDKLMRLIGDQIKAAGLISDDKLIAEAHVRKLYAPIEPAWTGALITVRRVFE